MAGHQPTQANVQEVTDKLQFTQLNVDDHWNKFWEGAFGGDKQNVTGYYGTWRFYRNADNVPMSTFDCIRAYKLPTDERQTLQYFNYYKAKPASGGAKQREDGYWEHRHQRDMHDAYFKCNIQLDPTEQTDGKLACNVWRGVPISDHAVIKFQPALPPLQSGPPQLPKLATEQAADAVWAAEGYLQDGDNRWSMGPVYSMQNLHLLTHMFIHEYATKLEPDRPIEFDSQPRKEARPMLDPDPSTWMDGGSWEGVMQDLLWDDEGEMYRCSPRPAAWFPPAKKTGRPSMDSLLSLKRLLLYPDMMYLYCPEKLPSTREAAEMRRGVRVEYGGMMRTERCFRRIILRYSATGEASGLTEEVYRPKDNAQ